MKTLVSAALLTVLAGTTAAFAIQPIPGSLNTNGNNYTAKAQVGGKLAQLGSRLIDSTAKKMADEFFGKFSETVGGSSSADDLDAGVVEEAKRIALEDAPAAAAHAVEAVEHAAEEAVHKVEEKVEQAAERGAFGGPMVWGLLALGAVVVILALMS